MYTLVAFVSIYSYLERQEFLQRTDMRQFELEREERLKKYRRLH